MEWLWEKPLFIVIMGLLTAVILGGLWLQTGRKRALYALLVALGVMGLLLVVERVVETDRERIDALLHHVARLVERNDIDAALRFAHSKADSIRRQARAELPLYEFHRIRIKQNLEITVDAKRSPATAVARFNVTVVLSDRSGLLKDRHIPRFVVVRFEKEGEEWRATHYRHHEPYAGFRRRDPNAR